jgi:hypothetical protein
LIHQRDKTMDAKDEKFDEKHRTFHLFDRTIYAADEKFHQ